ncbi:MAG: hypothetical protein AAF899_09765 [Pseudomonadota bacterium]
MPAESAEDTALIAHLRETARWCVAQRAVCEQGARAQIRVVWVLLIGGLVLLLLLPRLIQEIDFLWRESSLPPTVMERVAVTRGGIESNAADMADDFAAVQRRTAELAADRDALDARIDAASAALQRLLTAPYAIWREVPLDPSVLEGPRRNAANTAISAITTRGDLYAAGRRTVIAREAGVPRDQIVPDLRDSLPASGLPLPFDVTPSRPSGTPSAPQVVVARSSPFLAALSGDEIVLPLKRGAARTMVPLPGSRLALAIASGGGAEARAALVVGRPGGGFVEVPSEKIDQPGALDSGADPLAMAAGENGVVVVGIRGTGDPLVVHSEDAETWQVIDPASFGVARGILRDVAALPRGGWVAVGIDQDGVERDRGGLLLVSDDGVVWRRVALRAVSATDRVLAGIGIGAGERGNEPRSELVQETASSAASPDGMPIAAIADIGAVAAGTDGRLALDVDGHLVHGTLGGGFAWPEGAGEMRAGDINDVMLVGETAIAVGIKVAGSRQALLARSEIGGRLQPIVPFAGTPPSGSQLNALALDERGIAFAAGEGVGLLVSSPAEMAEIAARGIVAGEQPPGGDLWAPEDTAARLATIERLKRERDNAAAALDQQQAIENTAREALERQQSAMRDVDALGGELEQALRTADTVRQAGQIATRIAVIGLIIYLVQIAVNRYRYLQRLAGFYQARAQAFELMAASDGGQRLLDGMSLADLTAMLSPDGIGFDKAAEPPTQQLVSLLQAGLRRA